MPLYIHSQFLRTIKRWFYSEFEKRHIRFKVKKKYINPFSLFFFLLLSQYEFLKPSCHVCLFLFFSRHDSLRQLSHNCLEFISNIIIYSDIIYIKKKKRIMSQTWEREKERELQCAPFARGKACPYIRF